MLPSGKNEPKKRVKNSVENVMVKPTINGRVSST